MTIEGLVEGASLVTRVCSERIGLCRRTCHLLAWFLVRCGLLIVSHECSVSIPRYLREREGLSLCGPSVTPAASVYSAWPFHREEGGVASTKSFFGHGQVNFSISLNTFLIDATKSWSRNRFFSERIFSSGRRRCLIQLDPGLEARILDGRDEEIRPICSVSSKEFICPRAHIGSFFFFC